MWINSNKNGLKMSFMIIVVSDVHLAEKADDPKVEEDDEKSRTSLTISHRAR